VSGPLVTDLYSVPESTGIHGKTKEIGLCLISMHYNFVPREALDGSGYEIAGAIKRFHIGVTKGLHEVVQRDGRTLRAYDTLLHITSRKCLAYTIYTSLY
jgi:hypothetical protein